jgi:endonuclease/exonuclease/phosphatase family metal-dependent hydrolase
VSLAFRRCANRSKSVAVLLLATAGCSCVVALAGCGGASETSGALAHAPKTAGSTYTLLQMNLCLSGYGGCNGQAEYPDSVEEAVARIRATRPDAVTLNETCRGDVVRIARRTGYHVRFTRVIYAGELLPCVRPGSRGLFGNAVLTAAAVERTDSRDFEAQAGPERRRWLCVGTRVGVDVCTAHLNTVSAVEAPANAPQCAEVGALLARRAARRIVIFGGDVNRRGSCAPAGAWTRTDRSAHQAGGLQHVYGSRSLRAPSAQVLPAAHTDHDFLLVRAQIAERRSRPGSRR